MLQDIRYAIQVLRKNASFTIVATTTLALGIGANTLLFSVVHGVVLSPLPYPEAEELIEIQKFEEGPGGGVGAVSYPDFSDWREQATTIDSMAAYTTGSLTVTGRGEPKMVDAGFVSGDLFATIGVPPLVGRPIGTSDDPVGAERVAVIGEALATRLFGSANVVDETLRLDDELYTVIGVMPGHFEFPIGPQPPQIWTPLLSRSMIQRNMEGRSAHLLNVIARVRKGETIESAGAELKSIAAALALQYPETNKNDTVQLRPFHETVVGSVSGALFVLLGAVAGVLLIACANVAGLLLVKGAGRQRELTIRASLGARRSRLVRQLLIESLLLAAVGGGAGVLLAHWGLDALVASASVDVPRLASVRIDPTVLSFAALVSLLTGVLFGLLPAWQTASVRLSGLLNETAARGSSGARHARFRQGLVVAEVALALVLLTSAGLLLRSFAHLRNVDPGFRADRLLTGSLSLPRTAYLDPPSRVAFQKSLIERLDATPGLEASAVVMPLPLNGSAIGLSFEIEGKPVANRAERPTGQYYAASPGYFRLMGIPLLRGRLFDERDSDGAQNVILISQTFARRHFAGEDPLGQLMTIGLNSINAEIVGVVGDVKRDSLDAEPAQQMYTPFAQTPWPFFDVVVKSATSVTPSANTLRKVVAEIDATQAVGNIRSMEQYLSRAVAQPRLNAALLTAFGGLALLLASLGIYGVMAYSVAQRTREIGIRMALGADGSSLRRMVLRQGMRLSALGAALGIVMAFFATRLMSSLLFGVGHADVPTYAAVTLTLVATATLASYVPARRATRTDPINALRMD